MSDDKDDLPPVARKIASQRSITAALIQLHWDDITKQERRALEGAVAGYDAALASIKIRTHADKGKLGPRRNFTIVHED